MWTTLCSLIRSDRRVLMLETFAYKSSAYFSQSVDSWYVCWLFIASETNIECIIGYELQFSILKFIDSSPAFWETRSDAIGWVDHSCAASVSVYEFLIVSCGLGDER